MFLFVDSEIVRAMIQKQSYGFNTYAAVRVGKIQSSTSQTEWQWIEGQLNIADWTTRGKHPKDLDEGSTWQTGPEFLSQPIQQWPIKEVSDDLELPEKAVVHLMEELQSTPSISNLINIERYSKYDMVIRVTARVLSIFERTNKVSLRNALVDPGKKLIQKAESLWLHECQAEIKE